MSCCWDLPSSPTGNPKILFPTDFAVNIIGWFLHRTFVSKSVYPYHLVGEEGKENRRIGAKLATHTYTHMHAYMHTHMHAHTPYLHDILRRRLQQRLLVLT